MDLSNAHHSHQHYYAGQTQGPRAVQTQSQGAGQTQCQVGGQSGGQPQGQSGGQRQDQGAVHAYVLHTSVSYCGVRSHDCGQHAAGAGQTEGSQQDFWTDDY